MPTGTYIRTEEHLKKLRGKIPWNKGIKGVMPSPWNKNTKGICKAWNKKVLPQTSICQDYLIIWEKELEDIESCIIKLKEFSKNGL